jgi:hypothetical protein
LNAQIEAVAVLVEQRNAHRIFAREANADQTRDD